MSALALAHIPKVKNSQLTVPVSELRIKDVIIDGVGLETVTVTQVLQLDYLVSLVLISDENRLYFRTHSAEMEVIIQN